ncbi:MAG: Maf family protein [Clostridiales bacterium]|nr:Maf family protein [Clostridiales bacterium]
MSLILASASPRRREILKNAGFDFIVSVSECEEKNDGSLSPDKLCVSLASQKALDVLKRYPDDIVVGADTVVSIDNMILGKPKDEEDAFKMLRILSGKTNSVYTGVCIASKYSVKTFFEKSDVLFYELSDSEIEEYVKTGEPLDKAGSYGIQGMGCLLIKEIHGDFFNVVGLPVARFYRELKSFLKA